LTNYRFYFEHIKANGQIQLRFNTPNYNIYNDFLNRPIIFVQFYDFYLSNEVREVISEMMTYHPSTRFRFEPKETKPYLRELSIYNKGICKKICNLHIVHPESSEDDFVSNDRHVYLQNFRDRHNTIGGIRRIDENKDFYYKFDNSMFPSQSFRGYLDYLFELKDDVRKMLIMMGELRYNRLINVIFPKKSKI